jgi:hypothetical protein
VRIFMGKYIRYTDEFLARVREDADLVGIIGRDITQKRQARHLRRAALFTERKHPLRYRLSGTHTSAMGAPHKAMRSSG